MMKPATAFLLAVLAGVIAHAQERACPKYQVWGGSRCEWIAYCADGQPWQGQCVGPIPPPPPPPPPPTPTPTPTPVPYPMPYPVPTPVPPPPPTPPSCPGNQIYRDGRCVCPDGYKWTGKSCAPISRDCEIRTIFAPARGRKVLLVNGKAFDLFTRYIGDLELQKISPNYESMRVYLYTANGHRDELRATLTMGDLFLGTTYKDKWRRILRNKVAADRSLPPEDAKLLESDVICGQR